MAKAVHLNRRSIPEVRFWACFAVVFALLAHTLFPVQALAVSPDQFHYVLCNSDPDAIVAMDSAPDNKTHLAGLKCADCVSAAITGVPQPQLDVVPATYSLASKPYRPSAASAAIKARAPPRPHSCGPPSFVQV